MRAVCLALLAAVVAALDDSPVTKAVRLLSDLQVKVAKEGEDAKKLYSEFSEWCEDRSRDLSHSIKAGKMEAEALEASIAEAVATESSLGAHVEELAAAIATNEADLKGAREIRAKERQTFVSQEVELADIISTLQRAVGILEREMSKGGASMLQVQGAESIARALEAMVQASMLSTADAGKLTSLLQSSGDDEADAEAGFGEPAAPTYTSHSKNIVQVLTDLLDKAEEELADARKKETQDQHAFEMMEQGLGDEIKFASKELGEAKTGRASALEAKATAQGDLDVTSKDVAADDKALADLHSGCVAGAEAYEAETKSRDEELKALSEAKRVLQENVGGAGNLSYSFLQTAATARISSSAHLVQFEAARLVRDLAHKEHSAELAQLASRMGAAMRLGSGDDQFAKVKGMIRDMIQRLEKSAEQDATKKAFCDKELQESSQKKAEKAAEVGKLSTSIDKMTARSAQLKEEVAELQKALSELVASQAEMDKLRAAEKEHFAASKADMEQGLQGVKLALKILSEYYARTDKAHDAAEGAGSAVIGLLEVVESDFTKGLAEMSVTEENAQANYDAQTKENEIDQVTKEQSVKYKTKESAGLDNTIAETTSDRTGVQSELDAVAEYLQRIEAECVERAETYEERSARFKAELAGLREALEILESETALLQRGTGRALRGSLRVHAV